MAGYCFQCAGEDFPSDFAGFTSEEDWAEGLACLVTCEGCSHIQVDSQGKCISTDCLEEGHWFA